MTKLGSVPFEPFYFYFKSTKPKNAYDIRVCAEV